MSTDTFKLATRVQMTIEIVGDSNFGPNWQLGEVRRVAGDSAIKRVKNAFHQAGYGQVRLIGEPEVVMTLVEGDKK